MKILKIIILKVFYSKMKDFLNNLKIMMCLIINKQKINVNLILINVLKNVIKWEDSVEDLKNAKNSVKTLKKVVKGKLILRNRSKILLIESQN